MIFPGGCRCLCGFIAVRAHEGVHEQLVALTPIKATQERGALSQRGNFIDFTHWRVPPVDKTGPQLHPGLLCDLAGQMCLNLASSASRGLGWIGSARQTDHSKVFTRERIPGRNWTRVQAAPTNTGNRISAGSGPDLPGTREVLAESRSH